MKYLKWMYDEYVVIFIHEMSKCDILIQEARWLWENRAIES
jgi:hypothetical protein